MRDAWMEAASRFGPAKTFHNSPRPLRPTHRLDPHAWLHRAPCTQHHHSRPIRQATVCWWPKSFRWTGGKEALQTGDLGWLPGIRFTPEIHEEYAAIDPAGARPRLLPPSACCTGSGDAGLDAWNRLEDWQQRQRHGSRKAASAAARPTCAMMAGLRAARGVAYLSEFFCFCFLAFSRYSLEPALRCSA